MDDVGRRRSVGVSRRTFGGGVDGGWSWNDCGCDRGRLGRGCVVPCLVTSLRVLSHSGERSLPSSLFILLVDVVLSLMYAASFVRLLMKPVAVSKISTLSHSML